VSTVRDVVTELAKQLIGSPWNNKKAISVTTLYMDRA
jgi:hypothetical protein